MTEAKWIVDCECQMEAFLDDLEASLDEREEVHFIITVPHAQWCDIILDNIEADSKYHLPEGVEPFLDCTFVTPDSRDPEVEELTLDTLQNFIDQLTEALDFDEEDEEEDSDND